MGCRRIWVYSENQHHFGNMEADIESRALHVISSALSPEKCFQKSCFAIIFASCLHLVCIMQIKQILNSNNMHAAHTHTHRTVEKPENIFILMMWIFSICQTSKREMACYNFRYIFFCDIAFVFLCIYSYLLLACILSWLYVWVSIHIKVTHRPWT